MSSLLPTSFVENQNDVASRHRLFVILVLAMLHIFVFWQTFETLKRTMMMTPVHISETMLILATILSPNI